MGYAQLKSQDFPIPHLWAGKLPSSDDKTAYDRAVTGMKLACGFEMLLSDPQNRDKASVREMRMILEDVDTGDEELPSDEDIEKYWSKEEDDEKWLDIRFEDLDRELKGRNRGKDYERKTGGDFGDANAQENLQRIVARFEAFLNDSSAGLEGADFIDDFASDSGNDDDVDEEEEEDNEEGEEAGGPSFDEEEISRMMKQSLGLYSKPVDQMNAGNSRRIEELDTSSEEDDTEQIQELASQMEAELRGNGALDLSDQPRKTAENNRQIRSKGKKKEASGVSHFDENIQEDGNTNINLIRNMLESVEGQAGASGPAGNMLSMMGLPLPKRDTP